MQDVDHITNETSEEIRVKEEVITTLLNIDFTVQITDLMDSMTKRLDSEASG